MAKGRNKGERARMTLDYAGFVDGAGDKLVLSLKRNEGRSGFTITLKHREGKSTSSGFLTDQLPDEARARKEFAVAIEDAEKEGWTRTRRGRAAKILTAIPPAKPAAGGARRQALRQAS